MEHSRQLSSPVDIPHSLYPASPPSTAGTIDDEVSEDQAAYQSAQVLLQNVRPSLASLFRFCSWKDALLLIFVSVVIAITGIYPCVNAILVGKITNGFSLYMAAKASQQPFDLAAHVRPFLIGQVVASLICIPLWTIIFVSCQLFAENQIQSARKSFIHSLVRKPISWYDGLESPGALITRCETFFDEFESGMSSNFAYLLFYISKGCIAMGVAMYFSWRLTLIIIACLPVVALIHMAADTSLTRLSLLKKSSLAHVASIIDRSISAIQTVKLFNGQSLESSRFTKEATQSKKLSERSSLSYAVQQALSKLFVYVLFVASFWYGSHLSHIGQIQSGSVFTVFWCCNILAHSISALGLKAILLKGAEQAAQSIWDICADNGTTSKLLQGIVAPECLGRIDFKMVSFAYPSRPDQLVLRNDSFHTPAGQLTFIVGGSGSGKSTIHALIIGLYQSKVGSISVDGMNIEFLSQTWLRRMITVVQQESVIFRDSIENNIKLGVENPGEIDEETVSQAVRVALLEETIKNMPDGLKTFLDGSGSELSGGQRQRLALARAVVRNTPVLILDEATSALDIVSRSLVMDAIRTLRQGKTTIVITHDITQIQKNDSVIVMMDGQVVQQGTRDVLERDNAGAFAKLIKSSRAEADQEMEAREDFEESPFEKYNFNTRSRKFASRRHSTAADHNLAVAKRRSYEVLAKRKSYEILPRSETSWDLAGNRWSMPYSGGLGWQDRRASLTSLRMSEVERPYSEFQIEDYLDNEQFDSDQAAQKRRSDWVKADKRVIISEDETEKAVDGVEESVVKDDSPKQTIGMGSFIKLVLLSQKRKSVVFLGLLCAVLNGAAMPAFSFTFSKLLASLFTATNDSSGKSTIFWPLMILLVSVIDAITTFANLLLLEVSGIRWIYRLRVLAFRKVLTRDYSWFFDPSSLANDCLQDGAIINRKEDGDKKALGSDLSQTIIDRSPASMANAIVNNSEKAQFILSRLVGPFLSAFVMFLLGISWAFAVGWKLTLVGLGLAPFAILSARLMNDASFLWSQKYKQEQEKFLETAYEVITKIETVKDLVLEPYFQVKLSESAANIRRVGLRRGLYIGICQGVAGFVDNAIQITLLFAGSMFISKGWYSVAQVLTVFSLIIFSSTNTASILGSLPEESKAKNGGTNLLALAMMIDDDGSRAESSGSDHREPGSDSESEKSLKNAIDSVVEFRDVSFTYQGREVPVLQDVSLRIEPGESVAIVGSSGSGKSTLANLLTRLLLPTNGKVMFQGTNVMDYDIGLLRRRIGVVTQAAQLFDGSIYENIVYGLADNQVSRQDVEDACQQAGILELISSLSEGFETQLGGSIMLSGGQAQRIAIARAIVRKPELLILDECTSALDATSAEHVRKAIKTITDKDIVSGSANGGRYRPTVLIITHSREMMEFADRVAVLESGSITETGVFSQLLRRNNSRLANLINHES
ncbi:P-loop containing nucleoside triphosphate hydrolase protein [Myxozyma melibiosi]|uniref:P-loop containing nucleoside triphosphate hydrolase protein n=1 Tax=Myxozyma melibiosi TaxID=54550 RepID=A0ABR1FA77_9ASCO